MKETKQKKKHKDKEDDNRRGEGGEKDGDDGGDDEGGGWDTAVVDETETALHRGARVVESKRLFCGRKDDARKNARSAHLLPL